MKQIIVADSQGFCSGVRKAIDTVRKYPKVSILGELIHNKHVVGELEKENKKVIYDVTGKEDHPIVISAHGIHIETLKKLKDLGLEVIDTTCPLVVNIYRKGLELEQNGFHVLIIGDKNHVEVQGIASRLKNPIIVDSEEELSLVELPEKVGVICQSTCLTDKFEYFARLIGQKVPDTKIASTICNATIKHQSGARSLSEKVDIMIVVGDYSSSNTKKLAVLTSRYVETHHVETAHDLLKQWFSKKNTVGIAAGASTPDSIIEEVKSGIWEMLGTSV